MAEETTSRGARAVSPERDQRKAAIKDRLNSVQAALDEIEDQVRQDAQSLERLQDVFDVSYLKELGQMVNELELKVTEVAEEAERARERAREAEADLRAEQERLEKLWDVYKQQEAELEEAEQAREEAQREAEQARDHVDELESELESERRALRQAQEENGRLREQLADKEAKVEELSHSEDLEERIDDLEEELEEEHERLAKLYGVFEETQAERDDLAAELRQWRAWFDAHAKALEGVSRAVKEAPDVEGS